ncbi:hypothetical protein X975_02529, partial [Stegodyphus mimosarum]
MFNSFYVAPPVQPWKEIMAVVRIIEYCSVYNCCAAGLLKSATPYANAYRLTTCLYNYSSS